MAKDDEDKKSTDIRARNLNKVKHASNKRAGIFSILPALPACSDTKPQDQDTWLATYLPTGTYLPTYLADAHAAGLLMPPSGLHHPLNIHHAHCTRYSQVPFCLYLPVQAPRPPSLLLHLPQTSLPSALTSFVRSSKQRLLSCIPFPRIRPAARTTPSPIFTLTLAPAVFRPSYASSS